MGRSWVFVILKISLLFLPLALGSVTTQALAQQDDFSRFDESKMSGWTISYWPNRAIYDNDPQDWIVEASKNWMGKLPNETLLRDISIPGTHDSITEQFYAAAACAAQNWTISEQLNAGIRFFDMRVREEKNGDEIKLRMVHGTACISNYYFDEVLESIDAFFDDQPQETVLMSIMREGTAEPNFEQTFASYVTLYDNHFLTTDELEEASRSSVGQEASVVNVAIDKLRGKILVITRNVSTAYGTPNSSLIFDEQNYYSVWFGVKGLGEEDITLAEKNEYIQEYLEKAAESDVFVLNWLSGSTGMIPYDVAGSTNEEAWNYMRQDTLPLPRTFGIIIADFPGPRLIYRVIRSNFGGDNNILHTGCRLWTDHFDDVCRAEYGPEYGIQKKERGGCLYGQGNGTCAKGYLNGIAIGENILFTGCHLWTDNFHGWCRNEHGNGYIMESRGQYGCFTGQGRALCESPPAGTTINSINCGAWLSIGEDYCTNDFGFAWKYVGKEGAGCSWGFGKAICRRQ